jgi:hypothetical protein
MQNDFGARGGMFDGAGIHIAPIERVVEPNEVGCWTRHGAPVCRSSTYAAFPKCRTRHDRYEPHSMNSDRSGFMETLY